MTRLLPTLALFLVAHRLTRLTAAVEALRWQQARAGRPRIWTYPVTDTWAGTMRDVGPNPPYTVNPTADEAPNRALFRQGGAA